MQVRRIFPESSTYMRLSLESFCVKRSSGHGSTISDLLHSLTTRHGYEAQHHEAEAKPKLYLNHEAEDEAEALTFLKHEALTFWKHEAEAKAKALTLKASAS